MATFRVGWQAWMTLEPACAAAAAGRLWPLGQIHAEIPLLRRAWRYRKDPELQERIASIKALSHQCELTSLQEAA